MRQKIGIYINRSYFIIDVRVKFRFRIDSLYFCVVYCG